MKKYIVLVVLVVLMSNPLFGHAQSFSDVPKSHWSYESVQFAIEQQLVSGYEDRTFRPNQTLTQGHFAKMFANLLYKEEVVQAEQRLQKEMKKNAYIAYYDVLSKKGYDWMLGEDTRAPISRAYVSYFMYRAVTGANSTGEVAFNILKDLNITTAANYEQFKPWGSLTRAQAAGFLHRLHMYYITAKPSFAQQQTKAIETIDLTNEIRMEYTQNESFFVYENEQLVAMIYGQDGVRVGNAHVGQYLNKNALHCPYGLMERAYQDNTIICQASPLNKYIYYVDHIGGTVLFAIHQFKNGASAMLDYKSYFDELSMDEVRRLNVLLTNQTRAKFGVPVVMLDATLSDVAQYHSEDMAYNNFYSHRNLAGQSPSDRATMLGYHYPYVAEIIFLSPNNMFEAHAGWMNSPGHRSILIGANYRVLGTGLAARYDAAGHVGNLYYTDNFSTQ